MLFIAPCADRITHVCTRFLYAAYNSHIPEPLHAAHLIATGIVCGESRGQA